MAQKNGLHRCDERMKLTITCRREARETCRRKVQMPMWPHCRAAAVKWQEMCFVSDCGITTWLPVTGFYSIILHQIRFLTINQSNIIYSTYIKYPEAWDNLIVDLEYESHIWDSLKNESQIWDF